MSDLSLAASDVVEAARRRPFAALFVVLVVVAIPASVCADELDSGGAFRASESDDETGQKPRDAVDDMWWVAQETRERWKRERAQRKKEQQRHSLRVSWARQWLMGLRGFSGVYWIGQEDNPERLATTNSSGVALRFTKGLGAPFAFELDGSLGRTGLVTFDAEETRGATFARVKAGMVIRLSTGRLAPLVNFGFGVQGTTYRPDTNAEEAFEANAMYYVGVGLNFRVTRRFVAGLSASFDKSASERSVHGGLHLNVGWGR